MLWKTRVVPFVLFMAAASASALADTDAERESLSRIAQEIDRVQLMVSEASRHADTAARIQFRYDWLQRDLNLMRDAIDHHFDAPRQPRAIPPLRGDYRR